MYAYVSKSKQMGRNYYLSAFKYLKENNIPFKYWDETRVSYTFADQNVVVNSNLCIVLISNSNGIIGRGTYTEIQRATDKGIAVLVMYQRQFDNTFQFYSIKGIERVNDIKEDFTNYRKILFGANKTIETIHIINSWNLVPVETKDVVIVDYVDTFIYSKQASEDKVNRMLLLI